MEIKLLSDIHIEFGKYEYRPKEGDENRVLVLAGDIGVGTSHRQLIERLSNIFFHVVYLHGNHEFYHNEVYEVKSRWKEIEKEISNFTVLDDDVCIVNGVRFIGGTLWTSMYDNDWFVVHTAKKGMNDFRVCQIREDNDIRKLKPVDTMAFHEVTVQFIKQELNKPFDGPTVVVSHHLPLLECIDKQYQGQVLNGAFASNLEYIFRDYDFDVWVHGHTHCNVDLYDVYGKRVHCNPRGYVQHDGNPTFDENKIIII